MHALGHFVCAQGIIIYCAPIQITFLICSDILMPRRRRRQKSCRAALLYFSLANLVSCWLFKELFFNAHNPVEKCIYADSHVSWWRLVKGFVRGTTCYIGKSWRRTCFWDTWCMCSSRNLSQRVGSHCGPLLLPAIFLVRSKLSPAKNQPFLPQQVLWL